MSNGGHAILRPFVCVGLAYFVIGVLAPIVFLRVWGEEGRFSAIGMIWSLVAGAAGAIGALGLLFAFHFHGRAVYVMPLIFGGAPVVNSFVTIVLTKIKKQVNSIFGAGLVMVILGAVFVLAFKPATVAANAPKASGLDFVWQILCIALTIGCWGIYGPVLHKGQAAMGNSRMRSFIGVGLAYFAIAVVVPNFLLATMVSEESTYTDFAGTVWSLLAGGAGAVGALGIILAFNFGGKPVFVMPLVFGGAPVVNSFWTIVATGRADDVGVMFMTGLVLVLAGAVMVLVFAPRGGPPPVASEKQSAKTSDKKSTGNETGEPPAGKS